MSIMGKFCEPNVFETVDLGPTDMRGVYFETNKIWNFNNIPSKLKKYTSVPVSAELSRNKSHHVH